MFPNDSASWGEESLDSLDHFPARKLCACLVVRWVEKDEIEKGGGLGKPTFDWVGENGEGVVEGEKIFPKGFGGAGVLFDKEGGLSAPAESLDSVGTGAGKEIEHAGFRNEGAEGGKNSRSHAVLGRAQPWKRRDSETPTFMDPCGDAKKSAPSARLTRGFFFPMTFRWLLHHPASYASF